MLVHRRPVGKTDGFPWQMEESPHQPVPSIFNQTNLKRTPMWWCSWCEESGWGFGGGGLGDSCVGALSGVKRPCTNPGWHASLRCPHRNEVCEREEKAQ